jgi:hypothetical protein
MVQIILKKDALVKKATVLKNIVSVIQKVSSVPINVDALTAII